MRSGGVANNDSVNRGVWCQVLEELRWRVSQALTNTGSFVGVPFFAFLYLTTKIILCAASGRSQSILITSKGSPFTVRDDHDNDLLTYRLWKRHELNTTRGRVCNS